MRSHHRLRLPAAAVVVLAGALLVASSCADDAGAGAVALDPATTRVEYRFHDSSVPPEFHRSYSISVADGEARMVVDVYGDEIHDVTATVDDETLARLVDGIEALDVRTSRARDGCTGGTARELMATDADVDDADAVPALEVYTEVCGGAGESDADAIDAAVAPVRDLFDTETLLASG